MKVYAACSGEYSDFQVEHIFANRKDAEDYPCADQVKEYEVQEGPVETRDWWTLTWYAKHPDEPETTKEHGVYKFANPTEYSRPRDWDGRDGYVIHSWEPHNGDDRFALHIVGWDLQTIRKVYSEQRAQYIATH